MTDFATTFAFNSGVEEKNRTESVRGDMFPDGSEATVTVDPVEQWKMEREAIAAAYREKREARERAQKM